jgi:hypothetical protein
MQANHLHKTTWLVRAIEPRIRNVDFVKLSFIDRTDFVVFGTLQQEVVRGITIDFISKVMPEDMKAGLIGGSMYHVLHRFSVLCSESDIKDYSI